MNQHIAEILMKQESKQVGGGRNAELDAHLSSSNAEPKLEGMSREGHPYYLQKYLVRKIELAISYVNK